MVIVRRAFTALGLVTACACGQVHQDAAVGSATGGTAGAAGNGGNGASGGDGGGIAGDAYYPAGLQLNSTSAFFGAYTAPALDDNAVFRTEKVTLEQAVVSSLELGVYDATDTDVIVGACDDCAACPGEGACDPWVGWVGTLSIASGEITKLATLDGYAQTAIEGAGWIWFHRHGTPRRVPIGGGAVENVPATAFRTFVGVVPDQLYYLSQVDLGPFELRAYGVSDGNDTLVAELDQEPYRIVLRSGFFYWSASGNIYRMPQAGGPASLVVEQANLVFDVPNDGSGRIFYLVYFPCPEGSLLIRVDPLTGARDAVADDLCNPVELALDDTHAYVLESSGPTQPSPGGVRRVTFE